MDIFGYNVEKVESPQCPCCKCKITIVKAVLIKSGWIEYVCSDCRRTFAVNGNEIKILGWG